MKDVLLPSILANEGGLLRSAVSANELNNAFRGIQVPDDVRKELNELQSFTLDSGTLAEKGRRVVIEAGIDLFQEGLSAVATKAIELATGTAKAGMNAVIAEAEAAGISAPQIEEYRRLIKDSKDVGADGFSVLGEAYDANFTRYVEEIATTQTEFAEISKQLKNNAGSMTTLIDDFKSKGGQMARIADALEKGETVQISLQLDGKTIAKSTQAYFKGTGQAIVLTAKD